MQADGRPITPWSHTTICNLHANLSTYEGICELPTNSPIVILSHQEKNKWAQKFLLGINDCLKTTKSWENYQNDVESPVISWWMWLSLPLHCAGHKRTGSYMHKFINQERL